MCIRDRFKLGSHPSICRDGELSLGMLLLNQRKRSQHARDVVERFEQSTRQEYRAQWSSISKLEDIQLNDVENRLRLESKTCENIHEVRGRHNNHFAPANRGNGGPPVGKMILCLTAAIVEDDALSI